MEIVTERYRYREMDIVYYRVGEGKPLLILHGWGSSSAVMMPLAKNLGGLRASVLIDLPGFGESPDPGEPWGIQEYADMTMQFVNDQWPDTKPDLLVHSFGCRILLKLLSNKETSAIFDKIIITGGAGLKPRRSMNYYAKKWTAKLLKAPVKILPKPLQAAAMDKVRSTSLWRSLGSSDYNKLSGVMRETFVKSVNEYFDDQLHTIDNEILLLWGKEDNATPRDQAKRLEKGLKNSALVEIEDAGHYAFLDQPAKFMAIAKAYFEGE